MGFVSGAGEKLDLCLKMKCFTLVQQIEHFFKLVSNTLLSKLTGVLLKETILSIPALRTHLNFFVHQ